MKKRGSSGGMMPEDPLVCLFCDLKSILSEIDEIVF